MSDSDTESTNCLVCDDEIIKEAGNFIKITPGILKNFIRILEITPLSSRGLGRGSLRHERVILCSHCGKQVQEYSKYFVQVEKLEKKMGKIREDMTKEILSNNDTTPRILEDHVMTARNIICSKLKNQSTEVIVQNTDIAAVNCPIPILLDEPEEVDIELVPVDPLATTTTEANGTISQFKTKRFSIVIKKMDLLKHKKLRKDREEEDAIKAAPSEITGGLKTARRKRGKGVNTIRRYPCPDCGFLTRTKKSLSRHRETHKNRIPCPNCDKTFSSSYRLKYHMKCHDGTAQFTCSFANCKATFPFESDYTRHLSKHTGEKVLSCGECEAIFARNSTLKRHIREVHKKAKRYSCSECAKTFPTRAELISHEKPKPKGKPIALSNCRWCSKVFTRTQCLRQHEHKMHHIVSVEDDVPVPIPIQMETA